MPKLDIDYSNTIIYKIVCKDLSIKELYVGHTTNFVQRKYAHKQGCINLKTPDYNTKLYKTIRECGGWNNWEMTIVNFYNCKSHLEAREKEQEHFISLGATLNSVHPLPIKIMPEKVLTDISNNDTSILDNSCEKTYNCDICHYNTVKKSSYDKHLLTAKHKNSFQSDAKMTKSCQQKETDLICKKCEKQYTSRNGLWKHNKVCIEKSDKDLIMMLLKQNCELMLKIATDNTNSNNI
jgi:hypothetical protein